MSYTIDVYRGEAKAQKNILSFGAYVLLFPQLIAGPIVRYQTVDDQIDERSCSFDKFGDGVKRFVCGLGKKVLLANNIGLLWSAVSKAGDLTVVSAWLGLLAFAFQIYFDFSGYSDMAIGLGEMFGFEFLENFDHPYCAESITDFWRRWHISMGTWFRDYVYIPLGGNRRGLAVQLRNIAVVWLLTGFWHGASRNDVLWGAFYGVLLVFEKFFLLCRLKRMPAFVRHLYTLLCVAVGWVLFAFEDIGKGWAFFRTMFGGAAFCDTAALYRLVSYLPLLLLCALAATPLGAKLYRKCSGRCAEGLMTAFAPHLDQKILLEEAKARGLCTVDVFDILSEHKDEYIYYKTDHHFTSLGAYYCYAAWMQAQGRTAQPLCAWQSQVLCDTFRGTTYNKVNAPFAVYGTITAYYKTLTHAVSYNGGNYVTDSIYERKYLSGKDSYANCFAQFVVDGYAETHLIDLRFFRGSVSDYVAQNGITQVLYNIPNFASDTSIR